MSAQDSSGGGGSRRRSTRGRSRKNWNQGSRNPTWEPGVAPKGRGLGSDDLDYTDVWDKQWSAKQPSSSRWPETKPVPDEERWWETGLWYGEPVGNLTSMMEPWMDWSGHEPIHPDEAEADPGTYGAWEGMDRFPSRVKDLGRAPGFDVAEDPEFWPSMNIVGPTAAGLGLESLSAAIPRVGMTRLPALNSLGALGSVLPFVTPGGPQRFDAALDYWGDAVFGGDHPEWGA